MSLLKHLSNNVGKSIKAKIIVIESDDWGSIRMPSNKIRESLERKGFDLGKGEERYRYSLYDTLASKDDFEQLFNTLTAFKDSKGKYPVFTAMALVANPDFEGIAKSNFTQYFYEPMLKTLERYGIENAFDYWREGFQEHLFVPEFHGREHLNITSWIRKLKAEDKPTVAAFESQMWAVNTSLALDYQAAFDLEETSDLEMQHDVISSGLKLFEQLFNRRARFFVPPNGPINNALFKTAKANGIEYISSPKLQKEVFGNGKTKNRFHWLGKTNRFGQLTITRNCFFEPSDRSKDWVASCLYDIEMAFRYNKPAVISSHRVNYIGGLAVHNRDHGLKELDRLLKTILKKWPSLEFMTSTELGYLIANK